MSVYCQAGIVDSRMGATHSLSPSLPWYTTILAFNYLQYLLDSRPGKDTTDAEFQDLAPWSEKAWIECNKKSE